MNIVVLTSSRADYGIYLPLLKKLKADNFFNLKIVAFGSHLSEKYGRTMDQIVSDGFEIDTKIETLPEGDTPEDISNAMGITIQKFSHFWAIEKKQIDLILCLGDRSEMFAAISASIPFNIPVAHLHGGETTLGAIDNAIRHSITCMSKIHFTSTEKNARRVEQILNSKTGVYNVGALSLDNLKDIKLLNVAEFKEKFGIELNNPILVTFHPETVDYEKNEEYVNELITALNKIDKQILITMPNADTMGNLVRERLLSFAANKDHVFTVESLGTQGYFSAIEHCEFMIGNSSSGIIEAASFGKFVINIGSRQEGREIGENVIHCNIKTQYILDLIHQIKDRPRLNKKNIYGDGNSADKVVEILKKFLK